MEVVVHYFTSKKEALNACPNARWVYVDRKGIGGSDRWYASARLLKEAKKKINAENLRISEFRKQSNENVVQIELF